MPQAGATDDELRAAIRRTGLRATRGRIVVLGRVLAADGPLSHAELADALSGFDRATVYRNLMDLADGGLLRRFDVDHVWRFEALSLDPDDPRHFHFVCTDCGQVECLPVLGFEVTDDRVPAAVADRQIDVQIRGVCDGCRQDST